MNKIFYLLLIFCGLQLALIKSADEVEKLRTVSEFKTFVRENGLVIVYGYSLNAADKATTIDKDAGEEVRTSRWNQVDNNHDVINQTYLENNDDYEYADVELVSINFSRGDLKNMKTNYGIGNSDVIMFFKDGIMKAKEVFKNGLTVDTVRTFLDKTNFNDFVEAKIRKNRIKEEKEDAAEERRRAEKRRIRRENRYYYGGPRVSFGIGLGGYHRGYYGRHHFGHYGGWRW